MFTMREFRAHLGRPPALLGMSLAGLLLATPAGAQSSSDSAPPLRHEINKGLVEIISPFMASTAARLVDDLARAVTDGNELRVVTNIGRGSFQAIQDLLFMRGIDAALMNSAVLDYFRDKDIIQGVNLDRRIRYIAPLYAAEFHLVARTSIRSVYDLQGRKVNYGSTTSASNMTGSLIFGSLGVTPEVVHYKHTEAIERLRLGEIDAMIISDGKPWDLIVNLTQQDGIHLVEIPRDHEFGGAFTRTEFTSADYPNLIPAGQTVSTLANDFVLAAYNWPAGHPRHNNVAKFIEAYHAAVDELKSNPSYHEKWAEHDPYRDVPGWTRFGTGAPRS